MINKKKIKVLDHGFVQLIDVMGNDKRIVDAARVSTGRSTRSKEKDANLIDYLMRNEHTSPFEQVEFAFRIKIPIFVARQWVRHRTASLNEVSGRYTQLSNEFYVPEILRSQSKTNKQSSSEEFKNDKIINDIKKTQKETYDFYETMLNIDVSRELARINLPLSLYTEMMWKIDLHNLFHFLKLRTDKHAQEEIREYANTIEKIIKPIVPMAYESYLNHKKNSIIFSSKEKDVLFEYIKKNDNILKFIDEYKMTDREKRIMIKKIRR